MNNSPKTTNPVETMLGIATGFMVLFLIFDNGWLLYIALGVAICGLFFKPLAGWIEWGWMKIAKALGFVNSRIILSIIFFVILFPLALLSRLARKKDSLQLKRKQGSYFTDRGQTFTAKDLQNPW
jgi:hypothetical protein